jgi:hypothetical protein
MLYTNLLSETTEFALSNFHGVTFTLGSKYNVYDSVISIDSTVAPLLAVKQESSNPIPMIDKQRI